LSTAVSSATCRQQICTMPTNFLTQRREDSKDAKEKEAKLYFFPLPLCPLCHFALNLLTEVRSTP
jgi:hypothetical protein